MCDVKTWNSFITGPTGPLEHWCVLTLIALIVLCDSKIKYVVNINFIKLIRHIHLN